MFRVGVMLAVFLGLAAWAGAQGPPPLSTADQLNMLRANQGVLPGQEMFRHLQVRVASQAERAQVSQVPEYAPIKYAGHESGDFFFVRATQSP